MNKLLVITVLVALLAINTKGLRVARQAEEGAAEEPAAEEPAAKEPEGEAPGTLSRLTDSVKSYYDHSVNTASGYLDNIRGLKLEEKAKNMYDDTSRAVNTYLGIMQDQVYHIFYTPE